MKIVRDSPISSEPLVVFGSIQEWLASTDHSMVPVPPIRRISRLTRLLRVPKSSVVGEAESVPYVLPVASTATLLEPAWEVVKSTEPWLAPDASCCRSMVTVTDC